MGIRNSDFGIRNLEMELGIWNSDLGFIFAQRRNDAMTQRRKDAKGV